MVKAIRNSVLILTFIIVAGSNILWGFMNSYLACGFALAASLTVGICIERVFVKRSHREMIRRHGRDSCPADEQQPGP
ncbi:hypothetical protein NLM27_26895 [Bradyrhizobium sp. CCGB12]|uniref:hypothetical protein n=1 Tax=Bradyrhizobium sp. CCGB12 TaxID=2949632 RepID=UPI0020B1EDF0|nr:hypothetical protein [Bradyrhizobium sp. CCGB12]MCP3392378.1 hypothetical protein [Bradyrhizobium sp. CCGB12]